MKHDHASFGIGHNAPSCRICTCTDRDGLIEQLAEEMWDTKRTGHIDDVPWSEAAPYWRQTFRDFAEAAFDLMRRPAG